MVFVIQAVFADTNAKTEPKHETVLHRLWDKKKKKKKKKNRRQYGSQAFLINGPVLALNTTLSRSYGS